MKVLIVDDEADFLKIMETRLKNWGYDTIQASNGKAAIESAATNAPDAIILDYMLPDMDGVSVLAEIRKTNKEIPVVMLTAYPDEHSIKGAKALDISAFIPKLSMYTDVQSSLKAVLKIIEEKKETKG